MCTWPTVQNGALITKLHSQICTDTSHLVTASSLRNLVSEHAKRSNFYGKYFYPVLMKEKKVLILHADAELFF